MPLKTVAEFEIPDVGKIRVQSDIDLLQKGVRQLSKTGVPRAFTRAGNKSLLKTRTKARKALQLKFNLPATLVNREITSKNANKGNPIAYIQGRGSRIPLIKVKGGVTQKRLGVSINTGTGRRIIKGAFLATMPSGHTGVFKRTSGVPIRRVRYVNDKGQRQTRALPIRQLTFPPMARMLTNKRMANSLFTFYTRDFPLQLRKQLNFEFDKAGGRRRGL